MLHSYGCDLNARQKLFKGKYLEKNWSDPRSEEKAYFVNMTNHERGFRFKVSEHDDKRDDVFYETKMMDYHKDDYDSGWGNKEFENKGFRRWHEKRGSYNSEEVVFSSEEYHHRKNIYLSPGQRHFSEGKGHIPEGKGHTSEGKGHFSEGKGQMGQHMGEHNDLDYRHSDHKRVLDNRSTMLHQSSLISPMSVSAMSSLRGVNVGQSGVGTIGSAHRSYNCHGNFEMMNGCNGSSLRPELTRSLSSATDRQEIGTMRISNKRSLSLTPVQDDGMMATNGEDSIINLSSRGSRAPSRDHARDSPLEPTPMGHTNGETDSQDIGSPPASKCLSDGSPAPPGSKRKSRSSGDTGGRVSPPLNGMHHSVLMLAAQHGLTPTQIQQMLVAQQGAVTQQLMQAQQTVAMQQQQKVHEQALVQLNEQLQMNMLQQAQLLQDKKLNGKQSQQQLQNLAIQQQQIMQNIQQLQLQQRQLLVACLMSQPFSAAQNASGMMSPSDLHQIWKELSGSHGNGDEGLKPGMNGLSLGSMNGAGNHLLSGNMMGMNGFSGLGQESFPFSGSLIGQPQVKQEEGLNPLYRHGMCKWPGCDTECHDQTMFIKHLNTEHTLDDKNTAQARVQMQIVNQLEMQLTREKELLHAMMQHLHLNPNMDGRDDRAMERKISEKMLTSPKQHMVPGLSPVKPIANCLGNGSLPKSISHPQAGKQSLPPHRLNPGAGLSPLIIPPQNSLTSMTPVTSGGHHHSTSQPATPTGLGPMRRRVSDKCNLPISAEIQRNRDFYKSTDVRPPFTYASLIRQAIIESENRQLTLNEVYQWFQNTFAYFRRNEATWKNAVRHNLSLHKCFMRVENVKGAVWTVDEIEFHKRRPQKLTGAIPGSPSMGPDSAIYGDSLNASLRAALEQNGLMVNYQMSNGSFSDGGAEDLSMKSRCDSNDSFDRSPQRDDSMFIKPFHYPVEDQMRSSPRDYSTHGLDLSPRSGGQQSPSEDHPSPQGRGSRSSPVNGGSPNGKLFMADRQNSEPMETVDVRNKIEEVSKDRQQRNQDVRAPGDTGAMHSETLNFNRMVAPHLRLTQLEQTEALNMKQEVDDDFDEDYESESHLDLTFKNNRHQEQDLVAADSEVKQEVEMEDEEEEEKGGEEMQKAARSPEGQKQGNDSRTSPSFDRQSPDERKLTNQRIYSPLLHGNNVSSAVVSHSMS